MKNSITYADIAARRVLTDKENIKHLLKVRRRRGIKLKLEAARRSGTEIETAAKMILRICDGQKA